MRKIILTGLIAVLTSPAIGQKLVTMVPKNVQYVTTVNTPNITSKMTVAEMENLPFIKMMVSQFVKGRKHYDHFTEQDQLLKLSDLGFDFTERSYHFAEVTDSITYYGYLIKLNNVTKFEALNDTSMEVVKNSKKLKVLTGGHNLIAWNKNVALFLTARENMLYFKDHPEIYEAYGLEVVIDSLNYEYDYYQYYNEQQQIAHNWAQNKITAIFSKENAKKKPAAFASYIDDNAAFSVWTSAQELYGQYLSAMGALTAAPSDKAFPGGDLNYYLYFNKSDITTKSVMSLSEEDKNSYKNMFSNQLNPKFFNYIDANNFLAYYSYAYSVRGVLEEMPNVINSYVGGSLGDIGVAESFELLSVILDEEAIGNVICGDGIFVVTDITSKEVTYTAYEWDENYINQTEVTKTKQETMPQFLYMFSTKDEASIKKIVKLSMLGNKGLVEEDGFYSMELYKNAPFKLYLVIKDGVVFMCNSEQQLKNILNNKKVTRLSPEMIKDISSSPLRVSVDGKKIMSKIPKQSGESMSAERTNKMLSYAKENVGWFSVKQNKIGKEGLSVSAVYSFKNDVDNSLKYTLNFLNDLYLIEKGEK